MRGCDHAEFVDRVNCTIAGSPNIAKCDGRSGHDCRSAKLRVVRDMLVAMENDAPLETRDDAC